MKIIKSSNLGSATTTEVVGAHMQKKCNCN